MTQPFKHPVTGIYQFRKRVPKDLIPLVGKREEKLSLGTRDPREAKVLHARISAEVEARWAQLSRGRISLSFKQAVAMAGEIYRDYIGAHEHAPFKSDATLAILAPKYLNLRDTSLSNIDPNTRVGKVIHDKWRKKVLQPPELDAYLDKRGILLDPESYNLLRKQVQQALIQARLQVLKFASGDYSSDPKADRFPQLEFASSPLPEKRLETDSAKFLITTIFEDYAREKEISPASYKRWKPIIAKVAAEVPDARDLTKQWCIDWKDKLVKQGLNKSTVREGYLAALRAACTWGVANNRLLSNPVDGVTVAVPRKIKTRQPNFTEAEALTILRGTLKPQSDRMSDQMRGAFRWLPWLCAYSGARVGEIAQMRKQDIQRHDGVWLMWITPEAGSTKNGAARFVAVHPHLVEQGFLNFVKRSKNEAPLFYDPARSRGGQDGNPQHKKVGERIAAWVRKIGVDDDQIQPNHAWRHGFKTRARKVKMDVGARDYMQGHVAATEGEAYGEFEPDVLAHEIAKLQRFVI
jgi:integrase